MEDLFSQLSIIANEALDNEDFDPSRIEELLLLFEQEARASLAAAEEEHMKAAREAEAAMREAEAELDSLLDSSTQEFLLTSSALADAVSNASERYMDAALASAMATMNAAFADR
ncbi:hypothetical protein HPP92_024638 [Vanilla planifolia]|uniref:Uncharacterized protein n=1 Tax=Vanilla planifolia TaxID=51239 RepID=A0A835PK07_VANPL|nr:hypothetical protein HPP92_024638 [Vanilla planifolia]